MISWDCASIFEIIWLREILFSSLMNARDNIPQNKAIADALAKSLAHEKFLPNLMAAIEYPKEYIESAIDAARNAGDAPFQIFIIIDPEWVT